MTADNIYWYTGILIFIPWGYLIFLPNGRHTDRVGLTAAFLLLALGAYFTVRYLTTPLDGGGSLFSLDGLTNLFRSREMLLSGWFNYASFCLFAGTWQSHDSRQIKLPHIWTIPGLLLTMLAGPSGLLLYMVVRWAKTGSWSKGV